MAGDPTLRAGAPPKRRRLAVALCLAAAVLLVAGVAGLASLAGGRSPEPVSPLAAAELIDAAPAPSLRPPPTAPLPPPVTEAPTTAVPEPPPTAAPTRPPAPAGPRADRLTAFRGMGTWVDVFDWSPTYAKGRPPALGPEAVDAMAREGVQTLYIQTARADWTGAGDLVDPPVLSRWLERARANQIAVVPWYLPTFGDLEADHRRLLASAGLPGVAGVGVDIEDRTTVRDHAERNRRLVALSRRLRAELPDVPLSGVTLPNVVTDVLNRSYWPDFPWGAIAPLYDVWQPMGYWTNRSRAGDPYRDAHRYTVENIVRLRAQLGMPAAPVHVIGGIGDKTTVADIEAFRRASVEQGAIGGSLYDWRTQRPDSYGPMRAFRA